MNFSSLSFKSKLGFVSLVVLASQLVCPGVEAMSPSDLSENPLQNKPLKRKLEAVNGGDEIAKKSKHTGNNNNVNIGADDSETELEIDDSEQKSLVKAYPDDSDTDEKINSLFKPLTRAENKALIKKANEGDRDAQDEVVSRTQAQLIPLPIGENFFTWEKIEERAYVDDEYARVAVRLPFKIITEKFPRLFETITERAVQEIPAAQFNLGLMYLNGKGVEQNIEEAFKYFKFAADTGDVAAQIQIGFMYEDGAEFLGGKSPKNNEQAVEYYRAAAKKGDPVAQKYISVMYLSRLGVGGISPENEKSTLKFGKSAFKWLTLAANQGYAIAQRKLGGMYMDTKYQLAIGGTPLENDKSAFKWATLAANQGDNLAQANLGQLYRQGRGIKKDVSKACYWMMMGKKPEQYEFLRSYLKFYPFYSGYEVNQIKVENQGQEEVNIQLPTMRQQCKALKEVFKSKIEEEESNPFFIPHLLYNYKNVEGALNWIYEVVESLNTYPGFMIPGGNPSEEFSKDFRHQTPPQQVSWITIDGTHYMTFGEENIKTQGVLLRNIKHMDENYMIVKKALAELYKHFRAELEPLERELSIKRNSIDKNNPDCPLRAECTKLKEKLTACESRVEKPLKDIADTEKFFEMKKYKFKNFIRNGAHDRQKAFFNAYPVWKEQ